MDLPDKSADPDARLDTNRVARVARVAGVQESRIAAVEAIKTHLGKTDALLLSGRADHRQCLENQ